MLLLAELVLQLLFVLCLLPLPLKLLLLFLRQRSSLLLVLGTTSSRFLVLDLYGAEGGVMGQHPDYILLTLRQAKVVVPR